MESIYKVVNEDLVGELKEFPLAIVQKMIERQVMQGNPANVEVFQADTTAERLDGGFEWEESPEGWDFWNNVIAGMEFNVFFERYPESNRVYIVAASEAARENGENVIKTLEKYGGINTNNYSGNDFGAIYYIEPRTNIIQICDTSSGHEDKLLYEVLMATYTHILPMEFTLEVTMEEIAEKFGVDVKNLRIKE
jgi:hypothetical protein